MSFAAVMESLIQAKAQKCEILPVNDEDIVATSWKDSNRDTLRRALSLDDWAMFIVWSQI